MYELYILISWAMLWFIVWQLFVAREPSHAMIWQWMLIKTLGALTIATYLTKGSSLGVFTLSSLFADWLWTTTITWMIIWRLAYFNVSKVAQPGRTLLVKLLWSNLTMLVLGMMAERASGGLRWLLLTFASLCFFYILSVIWIPLYKQAQYLPRVAYRTYLIASSFVTLSWLLFPIIWLLSPLAVGWLDENQAMTGLSIMQIVTKVGLFQILFFALYQVKREPNIDSAIKEQLA